MRGEGERRERGEGEGRDGLGVCCSAPLLLAPGPHPQQPPLQLRVYHRSTSCFACLFGSAVGDSPAGWWVTLSGFGCGSGPRGKGEREAVTRCPLCILLCCAAKAPPPHPLFGVTGKQSQAWSPCSARSVSPPQPTPVPRLLKSRLLRVWPTGVATAVAAEAAVAAELRRGAPAPPSREGCRARAGGWAPPGGQAGRVAGLGKGRSHVPAGGWARTVGRPATVLGSQCPVTGSRLSRLSRRSRESG